MKNLCSILFALVSLALAACSGPNGTGADASAEDSGLATDAGPAQDGGFGQDAGGNPLDAGSDAGPVSTDGGSDAGLPPYLTPQQIGFEEKNPALTGSFIYWGNWGVNTGGKDSLEMMRPDGGEARTRFVADRIWSFGVARDAQTVAFSSTDPDQQKNWGVTALDAIQYTWIFRPGAAPYQLTRGNINDECHSFMPGDLVLLMCRRANFVQTTSITNDPWRIFTIDIASRAETFLTPLTPTIHDLGPALRDDGTILFWRMQPQGGRPVQTLMQMNGNGSGVSTVVQNSTGPRTSADGKKALFRSNGWATLAVAPSHQLGSAVQVTSAGSQLILDFDFSPDQSQAVFTMSRSDAQCDDLYIVNIDGSGKTRLVDCVTANKYPNGVAWVMRP